MDPNQDDIFDLDLDPELLIGLLGKLSLDNIPTDVSDTLQSLENRKPSSASLKEPEECRGAAASVDGWVLDKAEDPNSEENKRRFFASIGLVSGTPKASNGPKDVACSDQAAASSSLWNFLESGCTETESCHLPKTCLDGTCREGNNPYRDVYDQLNDTCDSQNSSVDLSDDDSNSFSNIFRQRGRVLDIQLDNLHDNAVFCSPSPSSFEGPHSTAIDSFHNVFNQEGKVFDIQLNDFSDSANFKQFRSAPVLSEPESPDNSSDSYHESISLNKQSDCLTSSDKSTDSTEKSVNSPDSGYDTSPYSSTVSPQKLPDVDNETSSTFGSYEDVSDEELGSIVAAIVEVENLLHKIEIPETTPVSVPVLKDAKNPEDQKERILNFLMEPMCKDALPANAKVNQESSQVVHVNTAENNATASAISPKASKKASLQK